MFILDGKIYMKYEGPTLANQDEADPKKSGASPPRVESDSKTGALEQEQNLSSHLMVIDANTLEPLRTVKRVPKPAEPDTKKDQNKKDQKKDQKDSAQASPERGSLKVSKTDTKDEEQETVLVAEPFTVPLEHIATWKSQTKPYRNQELCHDHMPIITDGKHLYVFGRNKLKRADGKAEKPAIVVNIYEIERAAESGSSHNVPSFSYRR